MTAFAHQEEVDLCWRMQLAGIKYVCPESVVYHVGGGSLSRAIQRRYILTIATA